jgi:hypothetical protein
VPDDDLLKPTIIEQSALRQPPWSVDSLVYPAFFGGPLAVTYLAAINARRLGVGERNIVLIISVGVAALLAQLAVIAFLLQGVSSGVQRFSYSLTGIAVWGVARYVQRQPFRIYLLRGGKPANLWGPGVAAVIASVLVQFVLVNIVNSVAG